MRWFTPVGTAPGGLRWCSGGGALGKAAAAVRGRTYRARNPADIGKVFLAAMVNR